MTAQRLKVARQRGRVAGQVNDSERRQFQESPDNMRLTARPRRIDKDNQTFSRQHFLSACTAQEPLHSQGMERHSLNPVCTGVFPRILNGRIELIDAYCFSRCNTCKKRQDTGPAVEIEDRHICFKLCLLQRPLVEQPGCPGIDLQKGPG